MKAVELLTAARDKLAQPGTWTQQVCSRDVNGEDCGFKEAVCFCSYGALYATLGVDPSSTEAWRCLEQAVIEASPNKPGVIAYNDAYGRKQEEVVAVFNRAIELAESA